MISQVCVDQISTSTPNVATCKFCHSQNKQSVSISARPGCVQVEVHCHWRNDRTIDWCKQEGIHVTAYAPLSSPQTMKKEGKDVPNLLKVTVPPILSFN